MKTYKKVSKKFLNGVIHDLIGIIHDYREENEKLRRLELEAADSGGPGRRGR